MSYNGYPNWETYTIALHLDQDLQNLVTEMVEDYDFTDKKLYDVVYDVKEMLSDWVWEWYYEITSDDFQKTVFHDMIHGCMTTCDWTHLAKHFMAEVDIPELSNELT